MRNCFVAIFLLSMTRNKLVFENDNAKSKMTSIGVRAEGEKKTAAISIEWSKLTLHCFDILTFFGSKNDCTNLVCGQHFCFLSFLAFYSLWSGKKWSLKIVSHTNTPSSDLCRESNMTFTRQFNGFLFSSSVRGSSSTMHGTLWIQLTPVTIDLFTLWPFLLWMWKMPFSSAHRCLTAQKRI